MPANNVQLAPPPLVRFPTLFPGQWGVPGTDNTTGLRTDSHGAVFYVDPNAVGVSDGRDGTNPEEPLATVAAALTHCRPYMNDVIVVALNSLWTYATPALGRATPIQESIVVTVPGVRIVGLAPSASLGVPWIPAANNAVCITVRAMDVTIEGFCFWDSIYTGATGILAQWDGIWFGENLTVRHCYFYGLAYGIQLDYSWNCHIEGNRFEDMVTAAIHNPSVFGEPDYNVIRDNVFLENAVAINLPGCDYELIANNHFLNNTAAIAILAGDHNVIHGNTISGDPAGANNFIDLTVAPGASVNLVSDNWLGCSIAQYDVTCSDAGSGAWVRNHCVNGETAAAPV